MRRSKIKIFLCCLICFFCFSHFSSAEKIEKIVAIVNGDIITDEELNMFIKMEIASVEKGLTEKKIQEMKKALLEKMIEDRLVLQEAKSKQMRVNENMVEERIKEIKSRAGSELSFEMALKSQGISMNDLREKLRNQLLIYALIHNDVRVKVAVSPKEVTEYFQAHPDEFLSSEKAVVESIFVKDKEGLAQVENELKQGKDFSEVAKKYSLRSSLGEVKRGQLKKELEDVIFSLSVGQCSPAFQVEDGYYIFLVRGRLAPSQRTLAEVNDIISAQLEDQKIEKALKEWIENLKEKAYISIRES